MSFKRADVSIKASTRPRAFCFLSLYTCTRACGDIMNTETESSSSTCLSDVWPNQPCTQRFSPFPLLSSEGEGERPWVPGCDQITCANFNGVKLTSHLCMCFTSTLISAWHSSLELALAIASLNKNKKRLFLCLRFLARICFYLAKAFLILAMQAQAHKCRNKNVFFTLWLRLALAS